MTIRNIKNPLNSSRVVADWIQFYHLSDDPFSIAPIVEAKQAALFHRTADIERQVIPFLNIIRTADSRVKVIVSDRGMGKTTLLRFIQQKVEEQGLLSFYVTAFETLAPGKTHVDLARAVLRDLLDQLLEHIVTRSPEIYSEYKPVIDAKLKQLGKIVISGQIFTTGDDDVKLTDISQHLREVLTIFRKKQVKFCVLFDNLDKYDAPDTLKVVFDLLRMPVSQSAFETILASGGFVFVTLATPLYEKMRREAGGDFSYLDDPFRLSPLRPPEAHALLTTRFRAMSAITFPIEVDAVIELDQESAGNIRKIFSRTRRALEYGAEHELSTLSKLDCARASREDLDFPAFLRQMGDEPGMKAGLQFVGEYLRVASQKKVQQLLKAAAKLHGKKKLTPIDYAILTEFSIGERPIRKGTDFEINDQDVLDFLGFLDAEALDAEAFVDWLLSGSAVPEFLFVTTSPVVRLGARVSGTIQGMAFVPTAKVRIHGRMKGVFEGDALKKEIHRALTTGLSAFDQWQSVPVTERPAGELALQVTTGIVNFYRAFALFVVSRGRQQLDLSGGVVESYLNTIYSRTQTANLGLVSESDARWLYRLNAATYHNQTATTPDVVVDARRRAEIVIVDILRAWTLMLPKSSSVRQDHLKGIDEISKEITDTLLASETKFAVVSIPGKTLRDFSLYFWPDKFSFWAIRNAGSLSQDIARSLVKNISGTGGVGKNVRLGVVALDTNAVVGGAISRNWQTGLFDETELMLPSFARFEIEFNESKSLKSAASREFSIVETLTRDRTGIRKSDAACHLKSEYEVIPGGDKALSQRIDRGIVDEARDSGAFLVTADLDAIVHAGHEVKVLLMPGDQLLRPFPLASIHQLLNVISRDQSTFDIRIFARGRVYDAVYTITFDRGDYICVKHPGL